MIVKITKEIDGIEYDYTYSDTGFKIERGGGIYDEAFDQLGSNLEYTETDEPVEVEEAEEI